MDETMGKRILRLRKNKGLTQDQLAEKLNVTAQAVSKWENDVSMPDIQTIPRLAEELGVTTDELLGVNKENKKSESAEEKTIVENKWDGGKRVWIFISVLLIVTGVSYLLSHMTFWPFEAQRNIWQIIWPVAVLGAGIATISKRFSAFSVGLCLCGAYFLVYNLNIIEYSLSWSIVVAVLLILLGLSILIDRLTKHRSTHCETVNSKKKASVSEENGFISIDISFGDYTHKMESAAFGGADVDISFGNGVLDLSRCTSVNTGGKIDADVSFGELKIFLPQCIRISTKADKAFSSLAVTGEPAPDAQYTVELDADISFGSVSVVYK